jgi:hypothetical protein
MAYVLRNVVVSVSRRDVVQSAECSELLRTSGGVLERMLYA